MKNLKPKNIDGISFRGVENSSFGRRTKVNVKVRVLKTPRTEVINYRQKKNLLSFEKTFVNVVFKRLKFLRVKLVPYGMSIAILLLAFIFGSYVTWNSEKSFAENQITPSLNTSVLGETRLKVYSSPPGQVAELPNEVFFNLTLEQLEVYLAEVLKTPETRTAEKLAERKIKLKEYLEFRKSPFVSIVDTLAELKHWKLVLAISNSESSLGKRCHSENCSGIGVEPGHPLWRTYANKAEWAKDLDRLLERRYKDWTLEQMNGVYNQPGSRNWILASKQVLEELQERNIE